MHRTRLRYPRARLTGSWYDDITAPSGSLSARGLNTINVDLSDLEQKRFLFRRQNLNLVNIATGSNFALLSVSLGTAPADFAVLSHPLSASSLATGSLVAWPIAIDEPESAVRSSQFRQSSMSFAGSHPQVQRRCSFRCGRSDSAVKERYEPLLLIRLSTDQ